MVIGECTSRIVVFWFGLLLFSTEVRNSPTPDPTTVTPTTEAENELSPRDRYFVAAYELAKPAIEQLVQNDIASQLGSSANVTVHVADLLSVDSEDRQEKDNPLDISKVYHTVMRFQIGSLASLNLTLVTETIPQSLIYEAIFRSATKLGEVLSVVRQTDNHESTTSTS